METKIFILILSLCFFSCINHDKEIIRGHKFFNYEIVIIDSCEYIQASNNSSPIHKQNCKNCKK